MTRALALLTSLSLTACTANGTFVQLELTGSVPGAIAYFDLSLDLAGQVTTARVGDGKMIALPMTAVLDVRNGAGTLSVAATARDVDGNALASANGIVEVTRQRTTKLVLTFGTSPDLGTGPDLVTFDLTGVDLLGCGALGQECCPGAECDAPTLLCRANQCETFDVAVGRVSFWRLDDGAGTTASDTGPAGNHGTVTNATWVAGKNGGALEFTGAASYVLVPDAPSLSLTTQITVAAWVKGAAQENKGLITHYDTSTNQRAWGLFTGNTANGVPTDRFEPIVINNGTIAVRKVYGSSAPVLDDTWHHVAMVFDQGTLAIYVDGQRDGAPIVFADDPFTTIHDSTQGLMFGALNSPAPTNFFTGAIDDVSIWSRPLAAEEIARLARGPVCAGGACTCNGTQMLVGNDCQ